MRGRSLLHILSLTLATLLALQAVPLLSQDADIIDNFENGNFEERWWFWEDASEFDCRADSPGYNSAYALRLSFDTSADDWPGCGIDVESAGGWAAASGLSFFWRSDRPGLNITVSLAVHDPTQTNPDAEGATPFEVYLQTPGEEWAQVTLPWSAFAKAEWVGDGGVHTLDPSRIVELVFIAGESQGGSVWIDDLGLIGAAQEQVPVQPQQQAGETPSGKFALWAGGTQLRGINTWQRVVVPEVDGDEFLGNGHVGPPYIQEDFNRMAAMGANYVNISGPGLFTEMPPYVLDEEVQAELDNLLAMIEQADMFAVITFRTGPGRSDFTFYDDDIEEWADPALVIDDVWTEQAAQDAWVEMWRHTAARYRDNPIVVGYDLMCEPNAADRLLDIWEGEDFYPDYAGTLYDWNQFYPRLADAIREVDSDTPILVSAMGWGGLRWLPYLEPVDDPRVVYMVHQYEPQVQYTHQYPPAENTYPGRFDVDWDDVPDEFNRGWLDDFFTTIDDFKAEHGVPVAVNEFGVVRWVPGGAEFMRDSMDLFEQRGMNHAFWALNPSWPPHSAENDNFDFWHGTDPNNHSNVSTSDLIEVIRANWSRNTVRPSNADW